MNPYRAAERAFVAIVLLALISASAWVITVMDLWEGVGWTALALFALVICVIVHDEWWRISDWWCRRRDEWDAKHSPTGENRG